MMIKRCQLNTLCLRYFFTSAVLLGNLLFNTGISVAQQFSYVNAGIVGVGRSSLGWADFDNDGDLDLLVTGNQGSGPYVASLYRNDESTFVNVNAGLTGIDNSSVVWGDYDNDGDPDILATGRSNGSTQTFLYNNANGVFTPVQNPFPAVGSYGAVTWGDIDGDGDLDALVTGNYSSHLFNNMAGGFTEMNVNLPAVSNSFASIGDYDNDGDQDIFIMGDVGGWPVSAICRNEGGTFVELDSTGIKPLASGSASWCDYDHDRDLDLLIEGFDQYLEPQSTIFRNNGDLSFTDIKPDIIDAALGTAAWGDFDNDGDADILITGQNAACGSLSSFVYRNNGEDHFEEIGINFEGAERGTSSWADYDNDGDLDVIISGFNGSGIPMTRLYRNEGMSNIFTTNMPPDKPANLHSTVSGDTLIFSWGSSADNSTPDNGLTYTLRVGTTPEACDILSSNCTASGLRLIPQPGNVGHDTTWALTIPDGTYYWSVQARDHSYGASEFSEEQIVVKSTVSDENFTVQDESNVYPNPFNNYLRLSPSKGCEFSIFYENGNLIYSNSSTTSDCIVDTTDWPAGIYFLMIRKNGKAVTKALLKV